MTTLVVHRRFVQISVFLITPFIFSLKNAHITSVQDREEKEEILHLETLHFPPPLPSLSARTDSVSICRTVSARQKIPSLPPVSAVFHGCNTRHPILVPTGKPRRREDGELGVAQGP